MFVSSPVIYNVYYLLLPFLCLILLLLSYFYRESVIFIGSDLPIIDDTFFIPFKNSSLQTVAIFVFPAGKTFS